MTETDSRPGEGHRGDTDDQSRAGEVSSNEGSRNALPPETLRQPLSGAVDQFWDTSAYAAVLERELLRTVAAVIEGQRW